MPPPVINTDTQLERPDRQVAHAGLVFPGVPQVFEHVSDRAEFKRVAHRPGVELYRAHIVAHAFEPHTHEAFGLGAIESGVERFRYAGSDHLAPKDTVVMMNPDELHTGRAETATGWRYRMLYIDPQALEEISGEQGWWFRDAVAHDALSARKLSYLLEQLWQTEDELGFDSLMFELLNGFRQHACVDKPQVEEGRQRFADVLEYMRANLAETLSLDKLALVAGLSPFHFLRSFKTQYHATPQQMLMALRLFEAKCLLGKGLPPAQVAAATGLSDQSHLNKAFVRRYGVTPARYQQQVRS
ncbi:AraC family transcriptional regulator [Undibacterium sp. CY18W]|uniref:AraC family transcriptional regulator n=1 Tax=Undibacterium hunanense TaxID=2762292 RepID=A0ABR6ZV41_9BURK|nr:AraC family transcriptional regulator [Undibacterium hunanense]MBC3919738.1 AraC family transcriptional regulator [Undibacterium hunanense]